MRELFGIDVAEILDGYDEQEERVEHLRVVYARQLKDCLGFDHVQLFGMINSTGNIGYYLFHGTRERLGVKLMKQAMWAVDPGAGNLFSDRLDGHNVLFTAEPDLAPLRHELLRNFASRDDVSAEEMEWHAILRTPYRETDVRPVTADVRTRGSSCCSQTCGLRQFAPDVTVRFP
jgi:hypothetical protein